MISAKVIWSHVCYVLLCEEEQGEDDRIDPAIKELGRSGSAIQWWEENTAPSVNTAGQLTESEKCSEMECLLYFMIFVFLEAF